MCWPLYSIRAWTVVDACREHHVRISDHHAKKYVDLLTQGHTVTLPGGVRLVPVGHMQFKIEPAKGEGK